MKTPIADFVSEYASKQISRFHMPGHKGKGLLGCERLDITEICGADVLYSPDGIIAESESNATALFGTRHTYYSAEGSSLTIKAMLALIKKKAPASRRARVLAARNVHKAFVYACALLDIDADWLFPASYSHLCACKIAPEQLDEALKAAKILPDAVYITSPDYLGSVSDISGLSSVCHKHGVPLLVDNAHGAYLAFTEPSMHPIALGADMCCDSAHKTLPVLTGGAYLHISNSYEASEDEIRSALALFASTSPSYLILQSLDLCNAYLADGYSQKLSACIKKLSALSDRLASLGFEGEQTEPLKFVFSTKTCGYSGNELAEHLRKCGIESEFADRDCLVLMATPENTDEDLERVYKAFAILKKRSTCGNSLPPSFPRPTRALSIRDAVFASSETVEVEKAEGRICASPTVSCPPAV
ncbi:MAG: PLP-dependent transferase, partial [Clostridia bacterium]|nr:PLP-dependent transferase [Clostridia bacterium]